MDNLNNLSQPLQQPNRSYAGIARTQPVTTFPKKEQAIIINVVEDLSLRDYIVAVGNIVQPHNVKFASRISNNRVCIYLSSTEMVDDMVQNHNVVKVADYELNIRRLITPARRLLMSNVHPCIPHDVIQRSLTTLGVQTITPITFLKASYFSEDYGHVMSFRRQLYMQPDDDLQLPSSIIVDFEGTSHRIFLSSDEITCFLCKEKGHITKKCPKQVQQDTNYVNNTNQTASNNINHPEQELSTIEENHSQLLPPSSQEGEEEDQVPLNLLSNSKKRTATTITDSTSTEDLLNLSQEESHNQLDCDANEKSPFLTPKPPKRLPKKIKISETTKPPAPTTPEMLEPAREQYLKTNSALSFDAISHFLINAYGNTDPLSLAKTYTENVQDLLDSIDKIYPILHDKTLKNRCTRLIKKVRKQLDGQEDTDTDTSSITSF